MPPFREIPPDDVADPLIRVVTTGNKVPAGMRCLVCFDVGVSRYGRSNQYSISLLANKTNTYFTVTECVAYHREHHRRRRNEFQVLQSTTRCKAYRYPPSLLPAALHLVAHAPWDRKAWVGRLSPERNLDCFSPRSPRQHVPRKLLKQSTRLHHPSQETWLPHK